MKRFVLTGAPGAGKTAILRQLELDGFSVVEEAATDIIALRQAQGIAAPWTELGFVDEVARLQRERLARASGGIQFHDRCAICTVALANYLRVPFPDSLARETARIVEEKIFEPRVFFIRNLGFIEPTAARRISLEESLRFERLHEESYRELGFDLTYIDRGTVVERTAAIKAAVAAP